MERSDEESIRAELWARRKVWEEVKPEATPEKKQEAPRAHVKSTTDRTPLKGPSSAGPSRRQPLKGPSSAPPSRRQPMSPSPSRRVSSESKKSTSASEQPEPSQPKLSKKAPPSRLLPKRLGLGRVDDLGGGGVRGRTRFAAAYRSGCVGRWLRVDQNGTRPELAFVGDVGAIPLRVVLPLCFEGLSEATHPLCLLARRGATRLLEEHPLASAELPAILPLLVPPLRLALACKERDVFEAALAQVSTLAKVAKDALLQHLDKLLPCLARHAFGSPFSKLVFDALRDIEAYVPNSRNKIKHKVPAFD